MRIFVKIQVGRCKYLCFLMIFTCVLFSCSDDISQMEKDRGEYIDIRMVAKCDVQFVVKNVSAIDAEYTSIYDVLCYKVIYRTEYMGRPIDASGLLLLPEGINDCRLIAYFHGTHIPVGSIGGEYKQVPSYFRGEAKSSDFIEVRNIGLCWASAGYAVFMPDYVGYGVSGKEEHPYNYYPEMFESNIDGLFAVKSYLTEQGYPLCDKLFLTGWSQGAGASLSAHKYIEESYSDEFTVLASSHLAGPYNFAGFMEDVISRKDESSDIMNILSWSAYSLNKFSGLNIPLDQIYAYPVYDQISALNSPSKKPSKVFNSLFLSRINTSEEDSFKKIARDNSFHKGWKPGGEVFLHHYEGDEIVPSYNTTDAYAELKKVGAKVHMYVIGKGSHYVMDGYIYNTIQEFNNIK